MSTRSRLRIVVAIAAMATALLTASCGGGGNPVGPEVKYCSDGSVAPGNDLGRCPAPPPPPPVETVSVSLSVSTSFVGVSYPMSKVTISASGQSTTGKTVTVAVTVNGSSSVVGSITLPEGSYNICATATSSTGVKSNESCQTQTIAWPGITGRFVAATPTGEYVPSGLWAVVENVDSVRVNADGTFNVPTLSALKDTAKVVIRGSNEVFPTLARVEKKYFGNYVQVSSVKNWTIPTGTYAGQTITLSLEKAYKETPPQSTGFFPRWKGYSPDTSAYRYIVSSYTTYPIKVAVYRGPPNFPLSAVDEAKLWARVGEMNQTMGFSLFVQSDTVSVNASGGIRATFNGGWGGAAVDDWSKGDYVSGRVNSGQDSNGNLSALDTLEGAAKHEFFHASGPIGHTCQWSSLMEQNCLRNLPQDLQREDVAYWHLMRRIRELERKYNTRFSMAQMHQGERVFLLGLSEDKVTVFGPGGW